MKIFHSLSLFMGYSSLISVNAEVDCEAGYKQIDSNEGYTAARKAMFSGFFQACKEFGLCAFENEACNLFDREFGDGIVVKGAYSMDFGSKFKQQKLFKKIASTCASNGGMIACLDGTFTFIGDTANFDFLTGIGPKETEGKTLDTDVEVKIISYPVCLPPSCKGAPLDDVLLKASKELLLASPLVQMELSDSDKNAVMSIDFESICTLANIERCEVNVEASMCGIQDIAG